MEATNPFVLVYPIVVILFTTHIIVNLFVAIVLFGFSTATASIREDMERSSKQEAKTGIHSDGEEESDEEQGLNTFTHDGDVGKQGFDRAKHLEALKISAMLRRPDTPYSLLRVPGRRRDFAFEREMRLGHTESKIFSGKHSELINENDKVSVEDIDGAGVDIDWERTDNDGGRLRDSRQDVKESAMDEENFNEWLDMQVTNKPQPIL